MSLKSTIIYIIKPKSTLIKLCDNYNDQNLKKCICEDLYLTNSEAGIDDDPYGVIHARIDFVKILYLTDLIKEYDNANELLQYPEINTSSFDKYWTIERVISECTFETMLSDNIDELKNIQNKTGNSLTDEWINEILEDRAK